MANGTIIGSGPKGPPMPGPGVMACGNCTWFRQHSLTEAMCFRFPPTALLVQQGNDIVVRGMNAPTNPFGYCGEFKIKVHLATAAETMRLTQ